MPRHSLNRRPPYRTTPERPERSLLRSRNESNEEFIEPILVLFSSLSAWLFSSIGTCSHLLLSEPPFVLNGCVVHHFERESENLCFAAKFGATFPRKPNVQKSFSHQRKAARWRSPHAPAGRQTGARCSRPPSSHPPDTRRPDLRLYRV